MCNSNRAQQNRTQCTNTFRMATDGIYLYTPHIKTDVILWVGRSVDTIDNSFFFIPQSTFVAEGYQSIKVKTNKVNITMTSVVLYITQIDLICSRKTESRQQIKTMQLPKENQNTATISFSQLFTKTSKILYNFLSTITRTDKDQSITTEDSLK